LEELTELEVVQAQDARVEPISLAASSSRMLLAALTPQFQKLALHRLLVQRKTFRVHLSAIFMPAVFGKRNFRISAISFTVHRTIPLNASTPHEQF
jgi:hypothetical protein